MIQVDKNELRNIEPKVIANYGLMSPETGLIDVHELASSFEKDIENNSVSSLYIHWLLPWRKEKMAFFS